MKNLTSLPSDAMMLLALFKEQPDENRRSVDQILGPLKHGRPVVMSVQDSRLPRKSRVKDAPVLMLVPSELFGGQGRLIVSLQGYGCEILDRTKEMKSISISYLGIRMSLARMLVAHLNRFYHGGSHGKTDSTKRRSP